jgi:hypothetical protein
MKRGIIIAIVGIALIGGALLFVGRQSSVPSDDVKSERTTREIATTCDPEMGQIFHIHPILEIVINGEKIEVPANIGVEETCMTALHTHTPDGVIHVESPEKRDFTLADFFAVWEQPFSRDEILAYKADDQHHIRVTINGREVDTYENTVLRDQDQILVSFEPI